MTYLITGGTGSLGQALTKFLFSKKEVSKVVVLSRDEHKQERMKRAFSDFNIRFFIGDIRDIERLRLAFKDVDYVIHAAALKSIDTCEYNPMEAIETNVQGTRNVIRACIDTNVLRATFISTDKAVKPINFYGATKMLGEKLWLNSNVYKPIFNVVRYGNVSGSNGSVIPKFRQLIKEGVKELPITNMNCTRFAMTMKDACELVWRALNGSSNTVNIKIVKSYKMSYFLDYFKMPANVIGLRQGEKLNELLNSGEDCVSMQEGKIKIVKEVNSKDYLMSQWEFNEMMGEEND